MKYLAPFALIFGFALALPTASIAQHVDVGPGGVSVGVSQGHDRDHHDRPVVEEHSHDRDHDHAVVRIDRDDHHDTHHDDTHHDTHHGDRHDDRHD